ncbi:Manganese/iron superoxide dismutase [Russula aff. rugulosa BPL654]|nr:Manganese/iron superoxide dismutase [Russula aff. rugulosa BPL654]
MMHCLARSLVTAAGCLKTTSAATRLAANWQRSAAARSTLPWSTSRRAIHVRVPLPYKVEDGMGNFLSPAALKVIAEDYQQGLLDRLNEQIKGKCLRGRYQLENMSVAQIVISTAPHESQTLAFNYASLALNNSFFLHHLVKTAKAKSPNHEAALGEKWVNPEQSRTLGGVIDAQMGSLQELKTYVAAAATGMLSSSGFVWLVSDSLGRLGVIATYGAGTLLGPTPQQTQTQTHSTTSPTSGLAHPPTSTPTPPGARLLSTSVSVRGPSDGVVRPADLWSSHTPYSGFTGTGTGTGGNGNGGGIPNAINSLPDQPTSLDTLGATLYPLFCVSVHEHAWMAGGYGVWGKEAYLEGFWSCLDWAAVRDSYALYALRSARR